MPGFEIASKANTLPRREWSFLNLTSNGVQLESVISVSLTILGLLAQSSALFLKLSLSSPRASALRCFSFRSLSWSVLDTEPGLLPCSESASPMLAEAAGARPDRLCWAMLAADGGPFRRVCGRRFGGTLICPETATSPWFRRELGLCLFSSGGPSSDLGKPFGPPSPFGSLCAPMLE